MTGRGDEPASVPPAAAGTVAGPTTGSALDVFRNRPFLLLWIAQAATQIGGNMVIFGLTVIISESTGSTTAVSALILTFLLPAVLFSALAGVFVDRMDRRLVLVATNILRGAAFVAIFLAGNHLGLIYLLNITVSTITVFFAPAEAAMIPIVVPALYFVAAVFCWTLPSAPPAARDDAAPAAGRAREAQAAIGSVVDQLREGLAYIRDHREIRWSMIYLGIAASLVGVLGVLGPSFAQRTLGLSADDFVVVVLPLGVGIVMGILLLNAYGRLIPRRRVIEGGLISLGVLLALMALSGRISSFLATSVTLTVPNLSLLTSLLSIVVAVAFFAGIAYAAVAIPSQTQLQEDLPEDVRGRVFGVLNMLVSVASFLPILIVGPIADLLGTTVVLVVVALSIVASGVASIYLRGPLRPVERVSRASVGSRRDPFLEALGAEVAGPEDFLDEHDDRLEDVAPRAAGIAAGGVQPANDRDIDPTVDPAGDGSDAGRRSTD